MTRTGQYLAAGVIYGTIATLMLAAACVAIYGAFWGNGAAALVNVGAIFGMLGCGATGATVYAFDKALTVQS